MARAAESKSDAQNDSTGQQDAESTPAVSPVKARSPRDTYYPNTEDLASDEMRVIACGTGMPTTRAAQAAACFWSNWEMATSSCLILVRAQPSESLRCINGSVSFSLEWNGLKFVFGSDTYSNKWFSEYAKNADMAIHECFIAVPDLVAKMRFTPESALRVGTQIHTAPEAFGKVMSDVKPRIADAYPFFKDPDTTAGVNDRIRKTYDGQLSLAEDFMVWNITKDKLTERMAVVEERTWAPPPASPPNPPNMADRKDMEKQLGAKLSYSDFIKEGVWNDAEGVLRDIYKEASDQLGREFPYPETTE